MVFVCYESTSVCMKKQMCVHMYVCVCVRRHKTLVIAFNSGVERRFDFSEYPSVWLTFLLPHANIIFNLNKPINMKQAATCTKTSLCSVSRSPFPSVKTFSSTCCVKDAMNHGVWVFLVPFKRKPFGFKHTLKR